MGIKEAIGNFMEKRREQKEMVRQMEMEDQAITKMQQKKKLPMERELEKYKEQERQKKIAEEVTKIRRERKYNSEMRNIPIKQEFIFKEDKKLFNSENIFMKKPYNTKHENIFKGKNIFTMKGGKK